MTLASPSRRLPAAARVGAVAAVAAFAVLAPIRMAQGLPKTRFAVVPAGVTAERAAAAATVGGPAIPPAPGPVVDSPFPLSHLGVRWTGSESATVAIRLAGPDGVWSNWRELRADDDLASEGGGPVMSDLILAHGATHAQVRAAGDARDLEILAIDTVHGPRPRKVATAVPSSSSSSSSTSTTAEGGDGGGQRSANAASSSSSSSSSSSPTTTTRGFGSSSTTTTTVRTKPKAVEPPVITRAQWGADESIRKNNQKYAPITKLFVHHTVTSPDGPDPDPAATVRAIYAYHVQGNGWDDIGYNFLIDAQGRVYEGRWARDYAPGETPTGEDLNENGVVGAHVLDHNVGSAGIAMLGDFTNGEPTTAARDTLVKLMAWKADRHGIDVMGSDPFTTTEGVVEYFPNLAGHRDAGQTECPGDRLYPLLPGIREKVAAQVTAVHGPTTGYWTATADGRVLPFGTVKSLGSMDGKFLAGAIVGMAPTPSGAGYWLLGSDGGIFSFGDAKFYGSTGGIKLNKPVVWMAPTAAGTGYWLVASDGGLFAFGVPYLGSVAGAQPDNYPGAVQMRATSTGKGYYIADANGGIAPFGDATFLGADTSQRPPRTAVDLVLAS